MERKAVSGSMLILLLVGILTLSFNIKASKATGPASNFMPIADNPEPESPSYTVWTDSGVYYAKDSNGTLVYSSTNASDVINWAMTTVSKNGGGTVLLLGGTYYLKSTLILQSDVYLQGESRELTKITVADSTSKEGFLNYHALVSVFDPLPTIRAEISDLTLDPNSKGLTFPLDSVAASTRSYYLKVHDCNFQEGWLNSSLNTTAAIGLHDSVSAEIYNNILLNQSQGIYATHTSYANIHDNYLDTSTWEGFYFDEDCYYNVVSGNTFRNASCWQFEEHEALQMHGSCKYNTVRDNNFQFCINAIWDAGQANIISNNSFNVVYNGIIIMPYDGVSEDIVTGNHIQNAAHVGIGIQDGSNVMVSSNFLEGDSVSDGLRAYDSNNVTFAANQVKSVSNGINLFQSRFCTVVGNEIATSIYGIYLSGGSNNTLDGNYVSSNDPVGIYLFHSQYNTVSSNIISNNTWTGVLLRGNNNIISYNNISLNPSGVYVFDADSNRIFRNNFIDNTDQVYLENPNNIWDDGYPSGGNYWSDYAGVDLYHGPSQNLTGSDGIGDTPYYIDTNNRDRYPFIDPWNQTQPDVAVLNVNLFKTVVRRGFTLKINVTATNLGVYVQTFNVTTYANATTIQTQTMTLAAGGSTTLTFTWNTTGFAYGHYTMSAYAWPVPGETYTVNNIRVGGTVVVTVPGDITGPEGVPDGVVGILDSAAVSAHWYPGPPITLGYDADFDINADGRIDILEAAIVSAYWTGPPKGPLAP